MVVNDNNRNNKIDAGDEFATQAEFNTWMNEYKGMVGDGQVNLGQAGQAVEKQIDRNNMRLVELTVPLDQALQDGVISSNEFTSEIEPGKISALTIIPGTTKTVALKPETPTNPPPNTPPVQPPNTPAVTPAETSLPPDQPPVMAASSSAAGTGVAGVSPGVTTTANTDSDSSPVDSSSIDTPPEATVVTPPVTEAGETPAGEGVTSPLEEEPVINEVDRAPEPELNEEQGLEANNADVPMDQPPEQSPIDVLRGRVMQALQQMVVRMLLSRLGLG